MQRRYFSNDPGQAVRFYKLFLYVISQKIFHFQDPATVVGFDTNTFGDQKSVERRNAQVPFMKGAED
jgi:hypothetical protein